MTSPEIHNNYDKQYTGKNWTHHSSTTPTKNTLNLFLGMRKIQGRIFNVVYPTKIQKNIHREKE